MKMKKAHIMMVAGALCLSTLAFTAQAEDAPAAADTPAAAATAPANPVAEALSKLTVFNGTPAPDAKYYIYLESASWCPPCRAEMPHIVKAYPEMRENGVEIILIGADGSPKQAEAYLKTFNATFPGVFGRDAGVANLPGFSSANYVPHAVMVDNQGKVLANGHGSLTLKWKKIIAEHESK